MKNSSKPKYFLFSNYTTIKMATPNFQEIYEGVIEGKFSGEIFETAFGPVKVVQFHRKPMQHECKQYQFPIYYIIILPFMDEEDKHIYVKMFKQQQGKKAIYNTELCLNSQKIQVNGDNLDNILTTYFDLCKDKPKIELPRRNISVV